MRHAWILLALAGCMPPIETASAPPDVVAYDVFIDTGPHQLTTYAISASYDPNAVEVVGVQGGDPPYDGSPRAVPATYSPGVLTLTDFRLSGGPAGCVRIARIAAQTKNGQMPVLRVSVDRVTDKDGRSIGARVRLVPVPAAP